MTVTAPEFVMTNPNELVLKKNIRDAKPNAELIASIKAEGVLVPITAYRDETTGDLVVHCGHRRTLAAVAAHIDTVPVVVISAPDDRDRVLHQWTENFHREDLTTTESARALEQLTLFGIKPAEIARRTGIHKDTVTQATKALQCAAITERIDHWEKSDLHTMALLAEFTDDEDAMDEILCAEEDGESVEHVVQRLRDNREREAYAQAARDQAVAALTAQGLTTLTDICWWDQTEVKKLSELATIVEGKQARLDPEDHLSCPGHVVVVENAYDGSARHIPACQNWDSHGHRTWNYSTAHYGSPVRPQDPEEKKAERRKVIQSNRDWDSAQTVRRAWIKNHLLNATKVDATAAGFVATIMTQHAGILNGYGLHDNVRDALGTEWSDFMDRAERATTHQSALAVLLAQVVAACEATLRRDSWRTPHSIDHVYLLQLSLWGYELSAIEKTALAAKACHY